VFPQTFIKGTVIELYPAGALFTAIGAGTCGPGPTPRRSGMPRPVIDLSGRLEAGLDTQVVRH
jgi:hypothetical protein